MLYTIYLLRIRQVDVRLRNNRSKVSLYNNWYRYNVDALSENGEVSLSAAYNISVYATADGYTASDKAEATLYWINANLENGTNINQVRTRGIVASAHDGIITLSGLDDGEVVKFFAADGKYLGSTVAANGAASYAVSESLVIAKVGKDSIKIAMK